MVYGAEPHDRVAAGAGNVYVFLVCIYIEIGNAGVFETALAGKLGVHRFLAVFGVDAISGENVSVVCFYSTGIDFEFNHYFNVHLVGRGEGGERSIFLMPPLSSV